MKWLICIALWLPLCGQQISFRRVEDETLQERLARVTTSNKTRMETLEKMFEEAGCTGEHLQRQKVKGADLPNVICTLPGTGTATVVVGAHHDFVSKGGTGSVDNWSGASLLPTLYQSLSAKPAQITFIFVGFAAEERGLIGSDHFIRQWEREKKPKLQAMVNIDSVGLSHPRVWVSRSDERLVNVMAGVAKAMKVELSGVNVEQVGESDSREFAARKIPVLDIHSVTTETMRTLHSAEDRPAAVQFEHYRDTYRVVAGVLSFLDSMQARAQTSN